MTLSDLQLLLAAELRGEEVISWHSKDLWDAKKGEIATNETALRLSKLLRDNRHTFSAILERLVREGHFGFLVTLLELEHADWNIEFRKLRVEKHVTRFDSAAKSPRTTKYALEQKVRRCRVAFEALKDYFEKENRNAWIVSSPEIEEAIELILAALAKAPAEVKAFNRNLGAALAKDIREQELSVLISSMPPASTPCYREARAAFGKTMRLVAKELAKAWDSDRYVRE